MKTRRLHNDREDTCERPSYGRFTCTLICKVHQGHYQQQKATTIHGSRKTDKKVQC